MAKKVYAYTDTVPESTTYITAGKRYKVLHEVEEHGLFRACSDSGNLNVFLWNDCAHLEGGNWTREEVEETP